MKNHGCHPFGNAKARAVVWNFPDAGAAAPRAALQPASRPGRQVPDARRQEGVLAPADALQDACSRRTCDIGKKYPLIMTSGRLVEYEGGGEETRSNPWLAELQQEMFVEINPRRPPTTAASATASTSGSRRPPARGSRCSALVTERVGRDTVFLPFHFSGRWQGKDLLRLVPGGRRADRARRGGQHRDHLRLRQRDDDAGDQDDAVPDRTRDRLRPEDTMARMKFICDAERCIECNGCVTACKEEHEVPWGVNRRRVVTLNDGVPGERSDLGRLHALLRRAVHGGLPGRLLLPHRRRRGAARQGPLHRLRLLLLRLPVRRAAVPAERHLRPARQDGQVHLLRRRPGGQRQRRPRYAQVRPQPPGRGQAAGLRRDVLDQGAARRRRRRRRRHLPHPGAATAARAARSGAGARPTASRLRAARARCRPRARSRDRPRRARLRAARVRARSLRRKGPDRVDGREEVRRPGLEGRQRRLQRARLGGQRQGRAGRRSCAPGPRRRTTTRHRRSRRREPSACAASFRSVALALALAGLGGGVLRPGRREAGRPGRTRPIAAPAPAPPRWPSRGRTRPTPSAPGPSRATTRRSGAACATRARRRARSTTCRAARTACWSRSSSSTRAPADDRGRGLAAGAQPLDHSLRRRAGADRGAGDRPVSTSPRARSAGTSRTPAA